MIKSRKDLKTAGIINAILIVAAFIVGVIILFMAETILWKINILFTLAALVFAFYYAFFGYKKDVAKGYKGFMIFYVATTLINIVGDIAGTIELGYTSYLSTILLAIVFICVVILAFTKDLKKTISTILGVIILVVKAIILIRSLVGPSYGVAYRLQNILDIVLAMLACFFVITKYIDKDLRGTT